MCNLSLVVGGLAYAIHSSTVDILDGKWLKTLNHMTIVKHFY